MPDFPGRLKTPRLGTAPSSPTVGELWYDTALNLLKWWNGTVWVAAGVQLVTALPGSPADGQECYFQSSAMATDGVAWHLRYRSASASAYKWEFLGGAALLTGSVNARTVTSTTYVAIPTDPCTLTIPLAGDYDITIQAAAYQSTTHLSNQFLSYSVGATAAADLWALNIGVTAHKSAGGVTNRHLGVAASASIAEKGRIENAGSGQLSVNNRRLFAIPVRVG